MSQQIYSIQFLNELHNHFPELLYNPRRFQNIQDVLGYIRSVAEISPYDIGHQAYNNRSINQRTSTITSNSTPIRSEFPVNNLPIPQTFIAMIDELPSIQRTTVNTTTNHNTNALMNTLIGGLFGDILGNGMGNVNLNTFLNERVPVYPTNQEIETASTIFRATSRQDDICTICQDDIENDQNVRRLTHCNHAFHQHCIDTWFQRNVHCPTCRHDIREVNQQDNNSSPPPVPENYRRMNIRRPDSN